MSAAGARRDRELLAAARAVVAGASRRSTGDRAYQVYLAVLGLAIYGWPMLSGGARALAPADAWAALTAPTTLAGVAAGIDLALLLALRLGRTLGPVRPAGGQVSFVLTSVVDRARALRGGWLLALLVTAVLALVLGADVVASRAVAGAWSAKHLLGVVAATGAGGVLAGLWLRGQTGAARTPLTLVALGALVAALAGTVLDGTPWRVAMLLAGPGGWWALATADPASPWALAAAVLAVLAALAACRVAPLLRALTVHELAAQAARVAGVSAGLARGNLLATSSALTSTERRGRALRLSDSRTGQAISRRDLLGLRRNPESAAIGVVLVASGAALGGLAVAHGWGLLPGALATALAALGVHVLSGGMHEHVAHAYRDSWLGIGYKQASVQHAWTPYAVAVGTWWVVTLALTPVGAAASFTWGPLVLAVVVAAEVAGSHRGDLPPGQVGVVTAEIGDTGAIRRAMWLVGMPLLGIGVGGGVLALAGMPTLAGIVGIVGFLVAAAVAASALDDATAR